MSRILDALKKGANSPKPLIFEKVSFDSPTPEAVRQELDAKRREIESKKESARVRYVANDGAAGPGLGEGKRHFVVVAAALFIACVLAVWLWPHPDAQPTAKLAEESVRLHEAIAGLESKLAEKQAEIDRLHAEPPPAPAADDAGELETLRGDVRRLNRQLAVMLQDNLEKDQEISRLQSS